MKEYDVIVIGGGPGGYAAAVRCSELGLRTALVEKDALGGTCVNWGCVPTKTMLKSAKAIHHQAHLKTYDYLYEKVLKDYAQVQKRSFDIANRQSQRIAHLLKKCAIDLFLGEAALASSTEVRIKKSGAILKGKNIILATGTMARRLPNVEYDADTIVTTREVWNFTKAPATAAVVGSGATGLEFTTLWRRFGSKVTLLEAAPAILPNEDADISAEAKLHFEKVGVEVLTGVKVESIAKVPEGAKIIYSTDSGISERVVEKVLVSVGIVPCIEGMGLEAVGVAMHRAGVEVNERMQTSVPTIYAIGDLTAKLPLGMVAVLQGIVAAEAIAGNPVEEIPYEKLPRCVYSAVEVASAGLTEKGARDRGYEVRVSRKPLAHASSQSTLDEHGGFIKLVADARTNQLLGAHLIGERAIDQVAGPAAVVASGTPVPEGEQIIFAV